ncbi:uncharacterized protein LOC112344399 [Selaginella moellendorffii]|uniref:uncharacterized protein LOC112344399 n=1 Tax=Selaginella moellendorffii TaxID=88036 RepID=UPI000D1C829C|nr:uncharacterized protein LOC112344399 [Selaginella moellendorffii]|eukprot:XP_024524819.1 uncharacterized protein LOC112344399 [Selaginella moellendorffii]
MDPITGFPRFLTPILASLAAIVPVARAQNVATSSTAAWSSQIVAFWGAVGIGVRASNAQRPSNPITSTIASLAILQRASAAASAIQSGNWYVFAPGYNGGKTRIDVLLLSWRTPAQLQALCVKVSTLAEVLARQRWLILLVGRQKHGDDDHGAAVLWTSSPRCPEYSTVRYADTDGMYSPLPGETIQALLEYTASCDANNIEFDTNGVTTLICNEILRRPTRSMSMNESSSDVQQDPGMGRYITSYQLDGVVMPYVTIAKYVGDNTATRAALVGSAVWMYCIVHGMVSVAVGLMGAASGRGLAVWLFAPRMVMAKLGAEGIAGDDALLSLLGFDGVSCVVTAHGANVASIATDKIISWEPSKRARMACLSIAFNIVELLLVVGGWLYGALKVEKLAPRGLVGHGMLWLATVVSTGLSLRTLVSVRERLKGRLIGIFAEVHHTRLAIARDHKISSTPSSPYLSLVSNILSRADHDVQSIEAALTLMRQPLFCSELQEHAAVEELGYAYQGDTLVKESGNKVVTTASAFPWIRVALCVCITILCSAFGPVYAYMEMPRWSKIAAEVMLAGSATWFATLARTSRLEPSHSTQICHMVATMVASAVWYVGVKDVG